jgi:hypothetical protein
MLDAFNFAASNSQRFEIAQIHVANRDSITSQILLSSR